MDMVSKALPDAVWLTSMEYSGRTLKIKGNALTNNMIADFIANLEATGLFSEVNLIRSTKSRRYKETEVYEFQLEAILTATPTEKTSQEEAK
jgi:Tfp pilus assembly protein PilN